ncbi:MAG: PP2C family protein-serine/threonine phosphatase [Tepidisphaeraceae bacterium]
MPPSASIAADQLRQVLEVSRTLAGTSDLDLLLSRIAGAATSMLHCERASIFLHDVASDQLWTKVALGASEIRVPADAGIVGHVFRSNSVIHVARPYEDPRFNREPDRRSGFVTRNLLAAPMVDLEHKPIGVIQAINKDDGTFADSDEQLIQLLADHAGVAVQRYHLQQEAVDAMALRREMDLARRVQEALIPKTPPEVTGLSAVGWTRPASMTGGDCYDLWKTADGRLGIFLGDASGHGIGPALIVSQTRTLIRAMCDRVTDPVELLACANSRLSEDLGPGQFVTALVALIASDGVVNWCSAGHGPILLWPGANDGVKMLEPHATPLGIVREFEAENVNPAHLEPGGTFAILSDGIFEARNATGELVGIESIIACIEGSRFGGPSEQLKAIQDTVIRWQGKLEPTDDQTAVIVMRGSPHKP